MEHCRDLTVVQSLCNGDSYAGTLLLNGLITGWRESAVCIAEKFNS